MVFRDFQYLLSPFEEPRYNPLLVHHEVHKWQSQLLGSSVAVCCCLLLSAWRVVTAESAEAAPNGETSLSAELTETPNTPTVAPFQWCPSLLQWLPLRPMCRLSDLDQCAALFRDVTWTGAIAP